MSIAKCRSSRSKNMKRRGVLASECLDAMCAYIFGCAYQKASTTVTLTNVTSCDLKHGLHPSRLPLSLQIHRQCCTSEDFRRPRVPRREHHQVYARTLLAERELRREFPGSKFTYVKQDSMDGGYVASILQQGYRRRVRRTSATS